jgi:Peptidase family M23/LysM domain
MIKQLFLLLSFLSFGFTIFSQEPIDTIYTSNGTVIMFSDRTWQYQEDLEFDGILNHHLHSIVTSMPDLDLIQTWDTDVCYTSDRQNDLSKLSDTIWLCVLNNENNDFAMPFDGDITSRYGYRKGRYHNGIDIDLETGDSVSSAWDGKVRYAQYNEGGFGNLVIVRHNNGLETFYAHLSKIVVAPNQVVKAGDLLGLGGNTGNSRGSHLHFEIRFYDAPINPEEVIDFAHKECKDENLLVHKDIFRPGAKPTDLDEHGENVASNSNAPVVPAKKYYKVKKGDNLTRIAATNGTTVDQLCKLNKITNRSNIAIGRTIRVK